MLGCKISNYLPFSHIYEFPRNTVALFNYRISMVPGGYRDAVIVRFPSDLCSGDIMPWSFMYIIKSRSQKHVTEMSGTV